MQLEDQLEQVEGFNLSFAQISNAIKSALDIFSPRIGKFAGPR
jgi:hypothetical protein